MLKYLKEKTSKTQVYINKKLKICIRLVDFEQVLKFIMNLALSV